MNKDFEYEYKVVSEVSAPTFYDIETNKILGQECDEDVQAYWVVVYDKTQGYIEEWVDRFYDVEEAKRFMASMKRQIKVMTKKGE